MSRSALRYLYLVTLLSHYFANCTTTDDEEPRRTFPFRRAIDGTRGRKFYDPEDDEFLHSYASSGRYDPDHQANDFSDIRNNVPGEPGVDYPSYTRLPQTGFVCETKFRGYYADEIAGCQVFHVCDGSFLVSSFLCPVGSIFSQKLLTCDWWSKVDCSATRSYHAINIESLVSEADDDEILRKAFEMASVQSGGERIPAETVSSQPQEPERVRHRVYQNYGGRGVTERSNDLQTGPDNYPDYPDYPSRVQSRFQSTAVQRSRQRHQEDDYYSQDVEEDNKQRNNWPIRVHTISEDRTLRNEFEPSYAPTVPTVITTTRRFYSPTFPTTYKPPTERVARGRFDLEVESSDHLYSAKGRSEETVKAATGPSVASEIITSSRNISLPILVNSAADERTEGVDIMEESGSSRYRTAVQTNATKAESSTEAIVFNDRDENITETLSILTIDNDNRNPAIFAYNREEETSPRNETNFGITSTLVEDNSTRIFIPEADETIGKASEFLEPQEAAKPFRIMVLKESSTYKNHHEASESEGLHINHSNSGVEPIQSIEVPNIRLTPPLFDGNEAARESRVIRIVINNGSSESSSSDPRSSSEKIHSEDSISSVEDSVGEHSEAKIVSEELPKQQEEVIKTIIKSKSLTSEAENLSITKFFSNDSTSLEDSHSIDVIDAAVALGESGLNAPNFQEKSNERSGDSEGLLLETKSTVFDEKKSGNYKKSDEILSTVSEEKNDENYEKENGNEEKLGPETTISQDKSIEHSIGSEAILLDAEAIASNEKIREDNEHSIGSEDTLLNAKTMTSEAKDSDNHERSSHSDEIGPIGGNIEDGVVEGSSPFQVTLTVNKNEELDPNGEIIRKLIAKQEIGDGVAAADHEGFEIVKSDGAEASEDGPEDPITAADSRRGRTIDFERYNGQEKLPNFRSNSLQSRDYYRSIVGLVNGPNMPRPFSLEPPQNIKVRTPSGPSSTAPLAFVTLRNDLNPVTARIPAQATRQPIASSSQQPESLQKMSGSSKVEQANIEGVLEQLSQTFGERQLKINKDELILELPQEQRLLNFETGKPLEISQQTDTREKSEEFRTTQRSDEKFIAKTVVETEFVPSISFSLNTDEEREEYMEAVMKGLLPDVRATESTNNDTNTSVKN